MKILLTDYQYKVLNEAISNNKIIIKYLKKLRNRFDDDTPFILIKNYLQEIGVPKEKIVDLYFAFINNYRENIKDYDAITNLNLEHINLLSKIKNIIDGTDPNKILTPDLFKGVTYEYDIEKEAIFFYMDEAEYAEKYSNMTGYEWVSSHANHGSNNFDSEDSEEARYISGWFSKDCYDILNRIEKLLGIEGVYDFDTEGVFIDFLTEYKLDDSIIDNFLYNVGYDRAVEQEKAANELLSEMKFPLIWYGRNYAMEVIYEKLYDYLLEHPVVIDFADLLSNDDLNDEVDGDEYVMEARYDNFSSASTATNELETDMQKLYDTIEENLPNYRNLSMITKLGFKKTKNRFGLDKDKLEYKYKKNGYSKIITISQINPSEGIAEMEYIYGEPNNINLTVYKGKIFLDNLYKYVTQYEMPGLK